MPIRGDFPEIRQAFDRIRKLGTAGPELWKRAAPLIRARIDDQFVRGVNPYGTKWKALAPATLRKGRTPPPLTDTGAMHASLKVSAQGNTLDVRFTDLKAGFHQWGTKRRGAVLKDIKRKGKVVGQKWSKYHIPKRQLLPDGRVPNEWRRIIRRTAREIMEARLGRKVTRGEMDT
jgi:phage gpG-like protein